MRKGRAALILAGVMACFTLSQNVTPVHAEPEPSAVEYGKNATLMQDLPGVYSVAANAGEGMDGNAMTMGIPSVAKQTLAEKPTTETPAIIMGAAVNYEEKIGPVEYKPFVEGTERVAPYSYFRYGIVEEQRQEEDQSISVHKKLSGFDGTYYIIRVDVSNIIEGKGEDQYLHVKQESNKALMVAYGMEGTTFSDALGNKTGSYSLAEGAKALKDNGNAEETPYFDVIVLSSGKLAAGADTGQADAPSADINLSFYVDGTADYAPELTMLDSANMPTFPYTVNNVTYNTEPDYIKALLTKFFRDENATAENNASKYVVKGSDLEIDVTVDEKENPDNVAEFWSLTKAIAYPAYDSHIVKLICEVPVLEGLSIQGTSDNKRSVILDVNSFDIQIANNSEQNLAALTISSNSELKLMDGSSTAGAELAIGNNATMVINQGGTLVIDESCTTEVEFDAASITDPTQQTTGQQVNGEITIRDGGRLINYGVLNVEGTEAKPQPQDPAQQQQETVIRDIRPAVMFVEKGGTLENYGCISVKGYLYILGTLKNFGRYADVINASDPDKGTIPYHKGIQVTWKDDVRNPEVVPGALNIGIDADGVKTRTAELINEGDIVIVPGDLNVYGKMTNTGKIYLADVTDAVVPIQPSQEAPLVHEIRVDVDPMRPGLIHTDIQSDIDVMSNSIEGATVKVVSNGILGDLTPTGQAKGDVSMLRSSDYVIFADDGWSEPDQWSEFALKDGGVDFSEKYLESFSGKRTVTLNVGFRRYTIEVTGTKKGNWVKLGQDWMFMLLSGGYAKNTWEEINGKWYFFDQYECMEKNAYRKGYYLTQSGAWDGKNPVTGWKQNKTGWWYSLGGSSYIKNAWTKIDGDWYCFKADGYAAKNEFVNGWWIGKNCKWTDNTRYGWHKSGSKWWYGAVGGWYAKSASYTIDGKSYTFDKNGFCVNP